MADEVQISPGSNEQIAKIRHPVAVPVLSLITIGIYAIYWWYQVNREMVDLGKSRNADGLGDNATTSLLAFFPGALVVVPPLVSLYNGIKRMQRAQEVTTGEVTLNGWIVLAVILIGFFVPFAGLIAYGYLQSEMNKVWEDVGGQAGAIEAPATEVAPAEGQPAGEPPAQV
jgi:hypothetical protein